MCVMCVCSCTDLRWLRVYMCGVSVDVCDVCAMCVMCVCSCTDLRWLRVYVCGVSVDVCDVCVRLH